MPPTATTLNASPETQAYFQGIMEAVDQAYAIAIKARAMGLDPDTQVEIRKAVDVAERVEALVGPPGVAARIRELEQDLEREEVAFKIAAEIIRGSFIPLDTDIAADLAVRAALAILTEGITAGPLEGIARVEIKTNSDTSPYLAVYYAGPIRAAGGTEAAVTVLVADYVRRLLNLNRYLPSDRHVERYVEEVELYERRVMHLQMPTTSAQIRFAAQNLPIEITGEPTAQVEVSGYRDIAGVETNRIRGGAILVLNDGVVGRSAKLLRIIDKVSLQGWEWLRRLKNLSNQTDTETESESSPEALQEASAQCATDREIMGCTPRIVPDWKYVADIIGGRPVFGYPMRRGGFRLRYGRSRNTGLAAVGIHPATMYIVDEFLAPGTHMRTERPGKGAIVLPVTSIEGPIVLLNSGEVLQIHTVDQAKKLSSKVTRILYNGDMIAGFGEFIENNHPLVPTGYCEECWATELQSLLVQAKPTLKTTKISLTKTKQYANQPFTHIPSIDEAFLIARATGIGLHPRYLLFWDTLNQNELSELHTTLAPLYQGLTPDQTKPATRSNLLIAPPRSIKPILERLGCPHKPKGQDLLLINGDTAYLLGRTLGFIPAPEPFNKLPPPTPFITLDHPVLDQLSQWAQVPIRAKGAFFVGARMGRPEKAKERAMRPPVHGLYPIGLAGGSTRNIVDAIKKPPLTLDLSYRICPKCQQKTPYLTCPTDQVKTEPLHTCPTCGRHTPLDTCPDDGTNTQVFDKYTSPLHQNWKTALATLNRNPPRRVKGVIGMMSDFKIPERLEKGILRSIHDITLFKDGTIRHDSTDAPLTHFRPDEIGVPIKRLKKLGYTHDYNNQPLTQPDQILELKVQDIVIAEVAADYLFRVANFVDDLLKDFYKLEPFYKLEKRLDLVGHLAIGISPHTSAGIIGRIIGFTKAKVGFAHPYWHAAKRRNCLAGDEPITLYNTKTQNVSIQSIKSLVTQAQRSTTQHQIVDDFGTIAIPNPDPDLRVISINPTTRQPILQPIKHWIKGTSKHWITITTATGRTLTMTPDHRTLTWNPTTKSLQQTYAHQLKHGDQIPLLNKLPLPVHQPPKQINILHVLATKLPKTQKFHLFKHQVRLRHAPRWMKNKLREYAKNHLDPQINEKSTWKLTHALRKFFSSKLPKKPYKQLFHYDYYKSIPLSHLIIFEKEGVFQWNDIPTTTRLAMARDNHTIHPYIPFTSELFRLLGYYTAEGYSRDYYGCNQTNISVSNQELDKHIKSLIKTVLGVKPYLKTDNQQLVISGKIHNYLIAYAWNAGTNAYSKHVPQFLYTLPRKYRLAYLSAYIDGDGSLPKGNKVVYLYSVSKQLLIEIGVLLNSLGIQYRNRKPSPPGHFGPKVLERYKELGLEPKKSVVQKISIRGSDLNILRELNLKCKKKAKRSKEILENGLHPLFVVSDKKGRFLSLTNDKTLTFDIIVDAEIQQNKQPSFCFEVGDNELTEPKSVFHNFYIKSIISTQCDADEDSIVLLMDGLLNFSKFFLPSSRGGTMDAPLVLSVVLNPAEVDDEVHSMDIGDGYPLAVYGGGREYREAKMLAGEVSLVADRLGTVEQYGGMRFTHPTDRFDVGPVETVYKTLGAMVEKTERQLALCAKIDAVDVQDVARRVLEGHYLPDIIGNLRRFGQQGFRCVKCNTGYRRPPISGACRKCGGRLILKVSEGNVMKYLQIARDLTDRYELGPYLKQRLELINQSIAGLFKEDNGTQVHLSDFL